jgi:hypothetical protein
MTPALRKELHLKRKLKSVLWGTKRRAVISVIALVALIATSASLAAFLIYSGGSGSANGATFDATQASNAINITSTATPVLSPDNVEKPFPVTFQNLDPVAPHGIGPNQLNYTVTSSGGPTCASHVTLAGTWGALFSAGVPSIAVGMTNVSAGSGVTIKADLTTPTSCATKTITVNFTSTTT